MELQPLLAAFFHVAYTLQTLQTSQICPSKSIRKSSASTVRGPIPPNSLRTDTEDSSRPLHKGGVASPQDQEPEPYSSCIQGIVSHQALQGTLLTHLTYRSRLRHQNSMRSMRPPTRNFGNVILTNVYRYCVRPNSGRIEPGKEVEVSGLFSSAHPNVRCPLTSYKVLLQAMKVEPPADTRCRDKFLVQSVAVTADKEFTNIAQIVRQSRPTNLEKPPPNCRSGSMSTKQRSLRFRRRRSESSSLRRRAPARTYQPFLRLLGTV